MLRNHSNGKSTAICLHGKKYQIHTKYEDGVERLEEWAVDESKKNVSSLSSSSLRLVTRKWKDDSRTTAISNNSHNQDRWEYEIGHPTKNEHTTLPMEVAIASSSTNPSFYAEDSTSHFIWKIENCPYPLENYTIRVDDDNKTAVLTTKNKKYYKRFQIPAMSRQNEKLKEEEFEMEHNVILKILKIAYRKPESVLQSERAESKLRKEALSKLEKEGNVDCRQS